MAPDDTVIEPAHGTAAQEFDIILKPVSHPDLGEIRIDEELFAIGRTEEPFASYDAAIISDLSRRHARIFSEYGAVYIADLDSKNGTTVNGINIRQKISRLQDGDEICFGRSLSYKVHLRKHMAQPRRTEKLVSLTLAPERADLGLQPIVVTRFPFLVSKADETFSRYKKEFPHQVTYLSRRHAHIFLKGGLPFIEDLGSTNGTFVNGNRLEEHAVPVEEGSVLAFGGHHFVYKTSLQKEMAEADPTVTRLGSPVLAGAAAVPATAQSTQIPQNVPAADKTTFVAAADSFLDIFCVDQGPAQEEEEQGAEANKNEDSAGERDKRRPRGKFALLLSQMHEAFAGEERMNPWRALRWAIPIAAVLAGAIFLLYMRGASERELKNLMARGEYAQAAAVADHYLKDSPDNAEVKALGTEALFRDNVPRWLALLKAHDFDSAADLLTGMKKLASHNGDAQSLVGELQWMGNIEKFVLGRGGVDAPIRMFADEDAIKSILKTWDEDTNAHQRALARIESFVPEFKEPYAEALSHLRKLQSEDSVYVAAIDRLKTSIETELNQDHPQALEPVLKEYAEKYPRLSGLDRLRQDLQQYIAIDKEARAQRLGAVVERLAKAQFSTPPFQARVRALTASNRLPPPDIVQQYQAVSASWHAGNVGQALAGMEKMTSGPWGDVAAKELERKKNVAQQFDQLQKSRNAKGYEDRLLAFYGLLDHDDDTYFIKATEADLNVYRNKALKQAQQLSNRAQDLWRRYRENGSIEGGQRLEAGISDRFRSQARLLAEARDDARQGLQIYTQLKAEYPAQWSKVNDEINTEMELQRRSLLELSGVLEPALFKAKLALLGGAEK